MRKLAGALLLLTLCVWLDLSVLPFLLPGGMSLRLGTIWVMAIAMRYGPLTGATAGFCAGFVLGALRAEPLGVSALALIFAGWAGGEAAARFHLSNWAVRMALAFGLLMLEEAAALAVLWVIFGVASQFQLWQIAAAALAAPVALWAAEPILGLRSPGAQLA